MAAENTPKTPGNKWVKGMPSPNAGGRPKTPIEIKEILASKTPDALLKLWGIISGKNTKNSDRIAALKLWLAYSLGQPVQATKMEATVTTTQPLSEFDPEKLTVEQLEQFIALTEIASKQAK